MSWARSYGRDRVDPRLERLSRKLGCSALEARGLWSGLRDYCVDFAPDGTVLGVDPEELAAALAWPGDGAQLLDALKAARLIIDGRVDGPEWDKRAEGWREAARKREEREHARISKGRASGTVQDGPGRGGDGLGQSGTVLPSREEKRGEEREEKKTEEAEAPAPVEGEGPRFGVVLPTRDGDVVLDDGEIEELEGMLPGLAVRARLVALSEWLRSASAGRRPRRDGLRAWLLQRLAEDAEGGRVKKAKARASPFKATIVPKGRDPPADEPGEQFQAARAAFAEAMKAPPGQRAVAVQVSLQGKVS